MARRRAPCQIRLSERTFGAGLSLQHAFGAADVHLAVRERQDCASPTWNSACAPASAARCRATSNIAVLVVQSERITDWSHIPSERRSDIAWAASNVDELLAELEARRLRSPGPLRPDGGPQLAVDSIVAAKEAGVRQPFHGRDAGEHLGASPDSRGASGTRTRISRIAGREFQQAERFACRLRPSGRAEGGSP